MRRAKERERIVSQSTCAFHLFRWQGRKKILFSTCALGGYLKASACCCWERRWRQMDLCLATHSGLSQWVGIRSSNFSKRVDNCDHEGSVLAFHSLHRKRRKCCQRAMLRCLFSLLSCAHQHFRLLWFPHCERKENEKKRRNRKARHFDALIDEENIWKRHS